MAYREEKRGEYMAKPRRNSDGTMSFWPFAWLHRTPGWLLCIPPYSVNCIAS